MAYDGSYLRPPPEPFTVRQLCALLRLDRISFRHFPVAAPEIVHVSAPRRHGVPVLGGKELIRVVTDVLRFQGQAFAFWLTSSVVIVVIPYMLPDRFVDEPPVGIADAVARAEHAVYFMKKVYGVYEEIPFEHDEIQDAMETYRAFHVLAA